MISDGIQPSIDSLFVRVFEWVENELTKLTGWSWLGELVVWRRHRLHDTYGVYGITLPILATTLVGGSDRKAIPLAAAWVLYDLASDIFDDLQDKDEKPHPWCNWPPDRAMLAGLGLLFAGQHCLAQLDAPAEVLKEIQQRWSQTGLLAALNQHSTEQTTAERYFEEITAKSGIIFSSVMWSGGRLASSETDKLSALEEYGLALGILIQLCDDGRDWAVPSENKKSNIQSTLYQLIAMGHPKMPRIQDIQIRGALYPGAEKEMLNVVFPWVAYTFVIEMMKVYEEKAISALSPFTNGPVDHLIDYARYFRSTVSEPLSKHTFSEMHET